MVGALVQPHIQAHVRLGQNKSDHLRFLEQQPLGPVPPGVFQLKSCTGTSEIILQGNSRESCEVAQPPMSKTLP